MSKISDKKIFKPLAVSLGASIAMSLATMGTATAATHTNPFASKKLEQGYKVAEAKKDMHKDTHDAKSGKDEKAKGEKKAGEGKCSAGKCGEGKCGG